MRRYPVLRRWTIILLTMAAVLILLCNRWVINSTDSRVIGNLSLLPENEYGLVLGTSPFTRNSEPNPHFYGRIKAAAELYREGKVRRLIVSGANPDSTYNEPRRMQQELIEAGVKASDIILDFAGDRTFDSVARAERVFGLQKATIITQGYHAYRAVFIGRKLGMKVIAYAAPGKDGPAFMPWAREIFARAMAVFDIFVFRTQPQYEGRGRIEEPAPVPAIPPPQPAAPETTTPGAMQYPENPPQQAAAGV